MSIEPINLNLCNGCGICVNTCPMDVIRLDTLVSARKEFPPCRLACPARVDIRSYIYLLKEGMVREAMSILREALPLPAVTGRVCHYLCESECARKEVDEAVNINSLERFVADYWLKEKAQPVRKIYAAKVAIVGSGPAGLAAAYYLTRMGYPVTVFEAMPELGGMLRIGIPEYRLPKNILDVQIKYIEDMGVEFKTGITIGKDLSVKDLQDKGYQAIFFAIGAQLSRKLDLDGAELDGVVWGLEFLRDVNLKRKGKVKDKVLVIGGGNVAIDVALTARRLGAKDVQLACLESREDMPAHEEQIQQAIEEDVTISVSWGPKRIFGDSKGVTGIELVRCVQVFDANGKFSPSFDEHTTKTIKTDMVVLAIGQTTDKSLIPDNLKITSEGTIQVDPVTLETNLPGIFAGGDVVSGAASVVEAFAAGRIATVSIDRYLRGEDTRTGRGERVGIVKKPPQDGIEKMARQVTPLLPVSERSRNFREVKTGFNREAARLEAQRCMTCGSRAVIKYVEDCMLCDFCELDCPQKAIYVSPTKSVWPAVSWG